LKAILPVGFLRPRRQPLAGIAKTGRFFERAGAQNLTDLGRFKTTAITYPIPETELGAVEAKDAGSQRPSTQWVALRGICLLLPQSSDFSV